MDVSRYDRRRNPYLPPNYDNHAATHYAHHLTIKESPHILLSCTAGFPHKIKFRKRVNVWPFCFVAKADYSRADRAFQYGCSCRDALLGGGVHLDLAQQAIEYRKAITVGPLSNLVLNGRCRYLGMLNGRAQVQPSFSLYVEIGRGAATWSGDGIAFRQKVPVTRHVGFEVIGSSHFPLPSVTYTPGGSQRLAPGQGTYEMCVDQLNPCIRF
ncbi:hypothetical protein ABBQ38_012735 [Trebouxia sp. C0009 RCD-2024]